MDVDTENESSSNGNTHNELYPIAVLIDELKSDNDDARLRSVKSLARIGKALGPERTRNELVPFVTESCDDNDDILKAIAASISELVPTVGGEQFAYTLLQPLESLCLVEDSGVRDAAIQAFKVIADAMPAEHHALHMAPLIRNLCDQDWFTSRISAALAIPTAYEKAAEDEGVRAEYVQHFQQLCTDDTPMCRRAGCKALAELVEFAPASVALGSLLPTFEQLVQDEQDSVKLLCIDVCVALAKKLPDDVVSESIVPHALKIASDQSWRVRWSVSNKIVDLCKALGKETTEKDIAPIFKRFLEDTGK